VSNESFKLNQSKVLF